LSTIPIIEQSLPLKIEILLFLSFRVSHGSKPNDFQITLTIVFFESSFLNLIHFYPLWVSSTWILLCSLSYLSLVTSWGLNNDTILCTWSVEHRQFIPRWAISERTQHLGLVPITWTLRPVLSKCYHAKSIYIFFRKTFAIAFLLFQRNVHEIRTT